MPTVNLTLSSNTTASVTYTINNTDTAWSVTLNSIQVYNSRSNGTTSGWAWHAAIYRRSSALNVSSQKNTPLTTTEQSNISSSVPSSISYVFFTPQGIRSKTFSPQKTSSSYTKTRNALNLPYLTVLVWFTTGDNTYAAAASTSCTVSAKKSYSVTYNGNGNTGGSMNPSTKWINETLTLSPNGFTRTNYVFYHWNTNTSNTGTSYNNKASYTANSGATLYAIWNPQITYNANGGTGAPSTQTKTFGTNINLSTTKPTRTGYTFLGWATSSTATTAAYQPGATHTANTALSLYAVWKVTPPTVRTTAYRVTSGDDSFQWGSTEPDEEDEGLYACVTIVTTPSSVASLTSISVTLNSHTATHTVDSSNASGGTVYALLNVSCDVNTKYDGTVSVSDNKGNTVTTTFYLAPAFFIMDFRRKGHAIALGGPADNSDPNTDPPDSLDIYYPTHIRNQAINIRDENMPGQDDAAVSENYYSTKGLYIKDSKDSRTQGLGYIRPIAYTTGVQGIQIETQRIINGTNYYNNINMGLYPNGDKFTTFQGRTLDYSYITTIASIITVNSSNATITSAKWLQFMHIGMLEIDFTNKNAISVPANGNIGDIVIGTVVSGKRPALNAHPVSNGDGAGAAWYHLSTAGNLSLAACEGTGAARTIAAGTAFNVAVTYIIQS